jgi:hypothetical protein
MTQVSRTLARSGILKFSTCRRRPPDCSAPQPACSRARGTGPLTIVDPAVEGCATTGGGSRANPDHRLSGGPPANLVMPSPALPRSCRCIRALMMIARPRGRPCARAVYSPSKTHLQDQQYRLWTRTPDQHKLRWCSSTSPARVGQQLTFPDGLRPSAAAVRVGMRAAPLLIDEAPMGSREEEVYR